VGIQLIISRLCYLLFNWPFPGSHFEEIHCNDDSCADWGRYQPMWSRSQGTILF